MQPESLKALSARVICHHVQQNMYELSIGETEKFSHTQYLLGSLNFLTRQAIYHYPHENEIFHDDVKKLIFDEYENTALTKALYRLCSFANDDFGQIKQKTFLSFVYLISRNHSRVYELMKRPMLNFQKVILK